MLSYQLLKNAKRLGSISLAPSYLPEEVACPAKTVVSSDVSTSSDLTEKPIIRSLIDANGKTHYLVKLILQKIHLGVVEQSRESARSVLRTKKGEM
jgi:hypothetical protein